MKKPTKYNQQPNKITLSRQQFSVIEKRMVYLVINMLDTGINVHQDLFQNQEFSIPVKELGETNYKRIREECKKLRHKEMGIPQDKNKYVFWDVNPFPEVKLNKNGILFIKMLDTAVPYFIELKKGFTTYQLKAALSLNSTYSQRLYELLSQYKDTGVRNNVEIDYLKKLLSIEGKYPGFGKFRERVLNPAQTELKDKTDISFTYELHKTGRKYTHITFKIRYMKPKTPLKQKKLTEEQNKALKYLKEEVGITDSKLQSKILNGYIKNKKFWQWLYKYRQNKENISNPAGHLRETLKI